MADGQGEERRSIRESAKSLKKYGSTCNHFKRQEHFVKHAVVEGETLQGIALKYGVTTEQIRRVNRLWASDSLFLRESLMIPVSRPDVATSPSSDVMDEDIRTPSSITLSTSNSDSEEHSVSDFLVKIDTSIANTKTQVKKSVGNSEFVDECDAGGYVRKKAATSRMRQHHQTSSSSHNDIMSAPHPVVMTQSRKVRSSLQRLEKEQDEIAVTNTVCKLRSSTPRKGHTLSAANLDPVYPVVLRRRLIKEERNVSFRIELSRKKNNLCAYWPKCKFSKKVPRMYGSNISYNQDAWGPSWLRSQCDHVWNRVPKLAHNTCDCSVLQCTILTCRIVKVIKHVMYLGLAIS